MSELRVWIDIDNPPQVQYLLPFQAAFQALGAEVLLTARAFGASERLIEARGARARIVGGEHGASKLQKVAGTLWRARRLARICAGWGRPSLVLSTSRAAALVSRRLRLKHVAIVDYEHVDLRVYWLSGCLIAFPDVIPAAHFLARGFRESRLIRFAGLKEDISFSAVDVRRFSLNGGSHGGPKRVLVRPPSESSHYYHEESGKLTRQVIEFLAGREDLRVLLSPRHRDQSGYFAGLKWVNQPEVMGDAIPFPDVLAGIDALISAGGTMVREAAYLGIPAFSTFRGPEGAVDRHLEACGRLSLIRSQADFAALEPSRMVKRPLLRTAPDLVPSLASQMLATAYGQLVPAAEA